MASNQTNVKNPRPTLANIARGKVTPSSSQSPGTISEQAMDEFLDSQGLWRKSVAKDGSCLFRVIAEEVYNTQSVHAAVRKECIQFMRQNADMFSEFVGEPFDHYLYKMQNPKEWGGEVEIVALSKLYSVDFVVYQNVDAEPINVTHNGTSKVIRLCYSNGNHYDIIYPKSYRETAAYMQGVLGDVVDKAWHLLCQKKKLGTGPSTATNVVASGWRPPSNRYRNIELEVYDETRKEQQSTDHRLASKLQLCVKDECAVLLRETKLDDGLYHKAVIENVVGEGEIYQVYVEDLQDSLHVAFEDIELPPDNTYQDLSGYYRKNDSKEDNYKVHSGKRRRNPRSRGGQAKVRQEVPQEARHDHKEGRPRVVSEKGAARNKKNDGKKNQGTSSAPASQPTQSLITTSKSNDATAADQSITTEDPKASSVQAPAAPAPILRGPEKDSNESSSQFWGKLKFKPEKPAELPHSDVSVAPSQLTAATSVSNGLDKASENASIKSNNMPDVAPDVLPIPAECNLVPANSATGTINKAEHEMEQPEREHFTNEEPVTLIESVPVCNAPPADDVKETAEVQPTSGPTFGRASPSFDSDCAPQFMEDKKPIVNAKGGSTGTSSSQSRSSTKKNKPMIILKKDRSASSAEAVTQDENRVPSPSCTAEKEAASHGNERKEKKVSFAADIKEFTPSEEQSLPSHVGSSMPDVVNGVDAIDQQSVAASSVAGVHQMPMHSLYTEPISMANPLMPVIPPNQQLHGVVLPRLGYFQFSVDPNGKDLPTDPRIIQHFFNAGIKYFLLEQQQQQQFQQQHNHHFQQLHASGQYLNPLATSTHQAMTGYAYNTAEERNQMFPGNMYNHSMSTDGYGYDHCMQPVNDHQTRKHYQQTNDGRLNKETHGRSGKKLYGKTNYDSSGLLQQNMNNAQGSRMFRQ